MVRGVQFGFVSFERIMKQLSGENLSTVIFLLFTFTLDYFTHGRRTQIPLDFSVSAQATYVFIPYCMCALFKQHLEIIMDRGEALGYTTLNLSKCHPYLYLFKSNFCLWIWPFGFTHLRFFVLL